MGPSGARGGEVMRDLADGFGDVAELAGAVGAESLYVLERAYGPMHDGAFAVEELELEAHGREGEEEIGEDDGGVDAEALGGGDGDLGGEGGGAADVEQRVMAAHGHVLRHVAAGLAEKPDRGAIDGLTQAGADEAAAGIGGDGFGEKASLPGARLILETELGHTSA